MTTTEDIDTRVLAQRLAILEDERDVRTTVQRMGALIDARDWDGCVALFCEQVRADWSEIGQPVAVLDPAELIAGWRMNLEGLESTQHLTAGHDIELDGDRASCSCYVIGTHRLANPLGDALWTVGGRYEHELVRTSAGWRIAAATLRPMWATGNQHIMALAAERTR